jgi:hypothetical protein
MFEILRAAPLRTDDEEHWQLQRRAARHSDEALTGTTRQWLRKLPQGRRPTQLCVAFPRVANRLAWCWPDAELSRQLLEDLLQDRRGGRRGFPPAVARELRRLDEFNAHQRVEQPARGHGPWWQALGKAGI